MITKNASNRNAILGYLDSIDENSFINDIVIPLFNQSGYLTLRINTHGPGEHGKDVVLMRHIPVFFDNEYLVVQAKAEKITTDNITEMAYQIIRALRTPIVGIAGGQSVYPNYVVLMNARKISNDAHFEFPYLVDGKSNIKVISQENVCEMMMQYSIVPTSLSGVVIEERGLPPDDPNNLIRQTLYSNNPKDIQNLFENVLFLSKEQLQSDVKSMVSEYIFNLWSQDRSWDGTIKPMKWLDKYFDFMRPEQFKYLSRILDEYISSTPSFVAQPFTQSIINKFEPKHILGIKDQYIHRMLDVNLGRIKYPVLVDKFISMEALPELTAEDRELIGKLKRFKALENKNELSPEEKQERTDILETFYQQLSRLQGFASY